MDEDRLDEVFTNNETDEACLQEMLELYMMRSDLEHTWDDIEAAERKVREGAVNQVQDAAQVEVTQRDSEEDQLPLEPVSLQNFTPSE